jgi:hypothetical protein
LPVLSRLQCSRRLYTLRLAAALGVVAATGLVTVGLVAAEAIGLVTVGLAAAAATGLATVGLVTVAATGLATVGLAAAGATGLVTVGLAAAGATGLATVGLAAAGATGLVTVGLVTAGATGLVTVGLVTVAATGAGVIFLVQASDSMGMATPGGGIGAIRIILIIRTLIIPIRTTVTMHITAIRTTPTVMPLLPPSNGSRLHSPGADIIAVRLMAK